MTRRTLQTLAAIIVGLVLLLLALRGNDVHESGPVGEPALPDFASVANDISKVRIVRPSGGEGVTLHLKGDLWAVSARDDYAADIGKLRQLIIALADARVLEEKTSNPEQYDKLGVGDPEEGGTGTKIIATTPEATYSVILGNVAQGEYRYARPTDQATSYLIDQNPDLPKTVGDWLLPDIVDIGSAAVRRVVITHADGESIVVEKSDSDQTDFVVAGVPEGRELSYATVGNGVAGALGSLKLEDVRKTTAEAVATTTVFETWDNVTISAKITAGNEQSWVSFAAETNSEESGDTDRVAEINARVSGWQYRLPDHKKNLLVRRWDDILKEDVE